MIRIFEEFYEQFDPAADRQCLYVQGRPVAERGEEQSEASAETDAAAAVSPLTRGYVLQRFVNACGGRGAYPIKFNGSIFTVEPEFTGGPKMNADWRRWGDCYWWQNTRLPYVTCPLPATTT